MISVDFIQDLAVVLAGAGLAGWVCRGLGLSATIGKMLHESGFIDRRFGQAAMGVTLVEDWATRFMFGILGTWTRLGRFEASSLPGIMGVLVACLAAATPCWSWARRPKSAFSRRS